MIWNGPAYELRTAALAETLQQRVPSNQRSDIRITIEPPWPPRIPLDELANQPRFGPDDAPINLTIFCSYPSSHCAKMMPNYKALLELYPEQIHMTFVDFPQSFHFNAGNAAVAARCAYQFDQFWPYHQGLLARFDELKSEQVFTRMATQVGINDMLFGQCLRDKKHVAAVEENIQLAKSLGLNKVPVTLINGLYLNGPKSLGVMRYYIDKELARIEQSKRSSPKHEELAVQKSEPPISDLPIWLEGLILSELSDQSLAIIKLEEADYSSVYKVGDALFEHVWLERIHQDHILIRHQGQLERVNLLAKASDKDLNTANNNEERLSDGPAENRLTNRIEGSELTQTEVDKTYPVEPTEIPPDLDYVYRGVVAPKGETPLSKGWLSDQLVYREELSEHFEETELDVEGHTLMRLNNIEDNDFYQTLGLENQDVIMRVNDQWLHSSQNSLFDTLENEDGVSIVLMRKGLPVHIHYKIL